MNDDFFSSVPFSGQQSTTSEPIDSFAHAIAARFGSSDLLTARLLPGDPTPSSSSLLHPSSAVPLPAPPHAAAPSGPFTPVAPSGLHAYLSDPATLILDIRPHAAHASARVHRALSLSVPSTLLKRPLFSLQKLSQMLPSQSARTRFSSWSHAARILVYDADSASVPESSNIYGLLRKFANEGFRGELAWLRGGFQAVWREARSLATTDSPSPEDEDEDNTTNTTALRTKLLPKAAFSLSSTTSSRPQSTLALALPTPGPSTSRPANPFFDTIRQNIELSQGITERIPLRLPRRVRRRVADLPFRWLQHIANRSAVRPATDTLTSESESSDDAFDPDPSDADADVEEGAEALAMQFYRIELAEQRRLLTVMEHHSKQEEQSPVAFPFSITAGVEKGAKNRYTHIWPFEHARVRLHDGKHRGSARKTKSKRKHRKLRKQLSHPELSPPAAPQAVAIDQLDLRHDSEPDMRHDSESDARHDSELELDLPHGPELDLPHDVELDTALQSEPSDAPAPARPARRQMSLTLPPPMFPDMRMRAPDVRMQSPGTTRVGKESADVRMQSPRNDNQGDSTDVHMQSPNKPLASQPQGFDFAPSPISLPTSVTHRQFPLTSL